jgi:hypothetical protein
MRWKHQFYSGCGPFKPLLYGVRKASEGVQDKVVKDFMQYVAFRNIQRKLLRLFRIMC